jgi:hypothetical protein
MTQIYSTGHRRDAGSRLSDPKDPAVRAALGRKCPDCGVEPDVWCVGIAEDSRTKGRRRSRIHFARCLFAAVDVLTGVQ